MTKITVSVSTIDGFYKAKSYKTVKAARKFAVYYVGETPDFGSSYAVSFDGVAKVSVTGCSLQELFFDKPSISLDKQFQVLVMSVDEDRGTTRKYVANSFDTLEEAIKCLNSDEWELYDGVELGGATEQARAEVLAWRREREEAYRQTLAKDYGDDEIPF